MRGDRLKTERHITILSSFSHNFLCTVNSLKFQQLYIFSQKGMTPEISSSKPFYSTRFMGCPQQTRVPKLASITFTLFPHISQRYSWSFSVTLTHPRYALFSSFRTKLQSSFVHGHRLDIFQELRCPRIRDRSFCTSI